VHVELAKLSDAVVEAVKQLPFVSDVTQDGNMLIVELKTRDDVRAQISQEITKAGAVIVSMSLKGQTLEEAFMQLITKSQGGKPK